MDPKDELNAFAVTVVEGCMQVQFAPSFDSASQSHDWARVLIKSYPGPYTAVRLDLSATPRLSSTFFAGLMTLHGTYTGQGLKRLTLIGVDRRTLVNLQILRLDGYFAFEP